MPRRPDDPATTDLERAIDRVFRVPLDEFVAARNQLAADLRKGGRPAEAARVKALEKPSVTAWAVNQVWWTDRAAFDRLLEAGRHLLDQQRSSLKGRAGDLRGAAEARQQAIAEVVELAVRAMGGADRVSAAMRQRLSATCDVLSTGHGAERTALGRLVADLQPTGMGALSAFLPLVGAMPGVSPREARGQRPPAPVTPFRSPGERSAPPARGGAGASPVSGTRTDAVARAEAAAARAQTAALAQARASVEAAETALRDARAGLEQRRHAVSEAARIHAAAKSRVEALEEELEVARREESAARSRLRHAEREVSAADTAQVRALRALEDAGTRLKQLDPGQ